MDKTQQGYRNYYNRRWTHPEKIAEQPHDLLLRALEHIPTGIALDLGAGAGRDSLYLARHGFQVTAVDFAASGIRRVNQISMREKLPLVGIESKISEFKLCRSYDLIICMLVLNHLRGQFARSMIEKMKSYTKAGGICVITTITKDSDSFRKKHGADYFYPDQYELDAMFFDWRVLLYRERHVPVEARWWTVKSAINTEAELIAQKS